MLCHAAVNLSGSTRKPHYGNNSATCHVDAAWLSIDVASGSDNLMEVQSSPARMELLNSLKVFIFQSLHQNPTPLHRKVA